MEKQENGFIVDLGTLQEHISLQRPAEEVYLVYESDQKCLSWSVAHWVLLSDNKTCTVLGTVAYNNERTPSGGPTKSR